MEGLSAGMRSSGLQVKENHKNNSPVDLESSLNVYSSPFKMEKTSRTSFSGFLFSHVLFLFITKY